jgi:parallel beta-helix repeat protein
MTMLRSRTTLLTLLASLLVLAGTVPPVQAQVSGGSNAKDASQVEGRQEALVTRQEDRIAAMDRLTRNRPVPFRAPEPFPEAGTTIVLTARAAPYRIDEVRALFPESFSSSQSSLLLKEHLFVGRGATLVVSSERVRSLRLLSTPSQFVTIAGWRSAVSFAGSRSRPLSVTSWDPARGGPDPEGRDGRAFILVRGSWMRSQRVEYSHLGFGADRASGVAWAGLADQPSRGSITDSSFHHNHIGAFTYRAQGMTWTHNKFWSNQTHGFDAHDFCRELVVEGNTASRNGGHGFLLSRGCRNNLLRGNRAGYNQGSGIVLDDGKVTGTSLERLQAEPSTSNLLASNRAEGNRDAGIVLEGGTRNTVQGNLARGGSSGIRVKDARGNHVHGNTIAQVAGSGVDLEGGSANRVTRNRVDRARVGIYLKRATARNLVTSNQLSGNALFGTYLTEGSARNRVAGNRIRGGSSGVAIKDAHVNRVDSNTISEITGSGISLEGDVHGTHTLRNDISGRGPKPIEQLSTAQQAAGVRLEANRIDGWIVVTPSPSGPLQAVRDFVHYHPTVVLWILILLLPILSIPIRLWQVRRTRRIRRLARASVPARHPAPDHQGVRPSPATDAGLWTHREAERTPDDRHTQRFAVLGRYPSLSSKDRK